MIMSVIYIFIVHLLHPQFEVINLLSALHSTWCKYYNDKCLIHVQCAEECILHNTLCLSQSHNTTHNSILVIYFSASKNIMNKQRDFYKFLKQSYFQSKTVKYSPSTESKIIFCVITCNIHRYFIHRNTIHWTNKFVKSRFE